MLQKLNDSPKLLELHQSLQHGDSVLIEELWNSPKALTAALAQRATGKHILILTGNSQEEAKLFHDFPLFTECPIVEYPAWETLPNENVAPSPDIVGERYEVLKDLLHASQPRIVLSNLHACLQRLIPPSQFNQLYTSVAVGQTLPFESFIEQLIAMGYRRCPVASDKGEFAVRGGIIDVFSVSSPDPFRMEFWGDEIESIRRFDPVGQKSVEKIERAEITPAKELEFINSSENLCTILDYLGENTLVVLDDLLLLEDRWAELTHILGKPSKQFSSLEQFLEAINPHQKLFWSQQPIDALSNIVHHAKKGNYYSESAPMLPISFEIFNQSYHAKRWTNPFFSAASYLLPDIPEGSPLTGDEILTALNKLNEESLFLLCNTETEKSSIQKKLLDMDITLPSRTQMEIGYLSSGFFLQDANTLVLPTTELTHRYRIRRQKLRSTYHTTPSEVHDLTPGEVVVHFNNGLGKFIGLEKRPNNLGIESEFFLIEYADNAKLYVPINQAHLVSKYVGSHEEVPKLHTLGSTRWKRTREHTERAILGFASELLQTYAKREYKGGFAFPEDSPDIQAFEEEFPFAETEDQLNAVACIKQDMVSPKAMDRLVCGDVGYGKTEVAMRAAFKAVLDGGKQVAMLVPTTVLAMQHYDNFVERMSNFPVNVAVLSRFRTPKQIKETLEGVEKGSVDIVIGTHRIISKDVAFKNLGLIIIDEEQRFGVKAKEHLKKIKAGVDCITLSATPIPRTLYMSLIGARDMSVINTPPQDRIPIKTVITELSDELLKNALLRELARDGQAYFIHNRVETLPKIYERIKKLLPQSRVGMVHGQMNPHEIDEAFHAFKSGRVDILIATTIVESGVDIPNANTILIDRADRFGLADLYQLRGRVGRWNRRAYAYFLIPKFHSLPEISRKRLSALAEASGYGGGMKLAMRDLELRGAGDILGTEQSGHVSAIGFHLYCKLLKRTIKALEGKTTSVLTDTKMEFPFDARLPEEYINEASLRMEIYQRLGEAVTFEEADQIWEEMRDRFGPPPEPVHWLYRIARIKTFASRNGFTKIQLEKIALISEQQKGKTTTVNRQLIGKISSPEELEKKVINTLKVKV
jgi:transcription-repair coupling factor (superfamily II helicase)